jgi:hypothetical protein
MREKVPGRRALGRQVRDWPYVFCPIAILYAIAASGSGVIASDRLRYVPFADNSSATFLINAKVAFINPEPREVARATRDI